MTRAARRAATWTRILDAARVEFGEHGYRGATMRAIAARAGVDASLVHQHFGTKSALFTAATRLEQDPAAHLLDVLDLKMEDPSPETRALLTSMLTSPEAAEQVRAYFDERARTLADALPGDDAPVRAALAVSTMLGLTIGRHFLRLEVLRNVDPEEMAAVAGPWLEALTHPGGPFRSTDDERSA